MSDRFFHYFCYGEHSQDSMVSKEEAPDKDWTTARGQIREVRGLNFAIDGRHSTRASDLRKYFTKCREYMQAYREDNTGGSEVENAVKKYKSHS